MKSKRFKTELKSTEDYWLSLKKQDILIFFTEQNEQKKGFKFIITYLEWTIHEHSVILRVRF